MQPDWVFKVASTIEKNNINFYQLLGEYDTDFDGFVTPDDIRMAFGKMQISFKTNDIDNMLKYFNLSGMDRISVKEFSKNFMHNK